MKRRAETPLVMTGCAVLFAAFSIIVFSVVSEYMVTFWIGYAAVFIAWTCLMIHLYSSFRNSNAGTLTAFLSIPSLLVSGVHLLIQCVAAVFVMAVRDQTKAKGCALALLAVFAVYLCVLLLTSVYRRRVIGMEDEDAERQAFLREARSLADVMRAGCADRRLRNKLSVICEELRCSSPADGDAVEYEEQILDRLKEASEEMTKSSKHSDFADDLEEILLLIKQRNAICSDDR